MEDGAALTGEAVGEHLGVLERSQLTSHNNLRNSLRSFRMQ